MVKSTPTCRPGDNTCLDVGPRQLLDNIRKGLIDPDTPEEAMWKKNVDGKDWKLVVSTYISLRTRALLTVTVL